MSGPDLRSGGLLRDEYSSKI